MFAALNYWIVSPKRRVRPKLPRLRGCETLESRAVMTAAADLISYRPVTPHIDYTKYTVSNAAETSARLGAGIRINGDDDNNNGVADFNDSLPLTKADDDLIRVDIRGTGQSLTLQATRDLRIWTTPTKSAAIPSGGVVSAGQQVWVEYVSTAHTAGTSTNITLTAVDGNFTASDTIVFHSFQSEVFVIGGFTQDPATDAGTSVFVIGTELYRRGYDVQLYGEFEVAENGRGAVYNEALRAITDRGVSSLAIVGYSWGGGGTHDLSYRLSKTSAIAGRYQLAYSAYVDAIVHYSLGQSERRLPVGSQYHDNLYQQNDFFLQGDSVAGAKNLNVNNRAWGATLRHTSIANDATVRNLIARNLQARLRVR